MIGESTNVLLIEDNPSDARLIKELLIDTKQPYQLKQSTRLNSGLHAILTEQFDVVLLDLSLPDSQGMETFMRLKSTAVKTPTIILTGLNDESIAAQAVHNGAQDYLVKGTIEGSQLQRSIRYAIERQMLLNELTEKTLTLEERNKALDGFAHTLAHQVKGVLAQTIGYASFVEMYYAEELDEEFSNVVSKILQSGHKMSNIIDELLLLASTRKSEVQMSHLNMDKIIAEAKRRLRFDIERYQGTLTYPNQWPKTQGHAPWIEEVWVNYISNGLKYGGTPPTLEIGCAPSSSDMVRFWVKDNGQGISEDDQKKLFKPHSRLLQHQVRGEGLGLSVVKRIVEKCGGSVGVKSVLNQGSTFWFTLPTM